MSAGCCGNGVRNVPLAAMRTNKRQEVVRGRARSGERPGQDRHEPIHRGFGKNILFLTILGGPLARQSATKYPLIPDRAQRVNFALRVPHALCAHEPRGWRGVVACRQGRFRDRQKQDVFAEAPMDGFTAVPKTPCPTHRRATQSVRFLVS